MKESKRADLVGKRIDANTMKHYVDGVEVASLVEVCIRLGLPHTGNPNNKSKSSYYNPIMNGVHAKRAELLPEAYLYGSAYYYPVDAIESAIERFQSEATVKVTRNDKLGKLLAKLKENPELLEMLSSLVE
jgi:hypothetical protein